MRGGDLIVNDWEYTSDFDMLVWELEKERRRINDIF